MNKADLVNAVTSQSDLSKRQATDAVHAVFSAIEQALKAGEDVTLVGFGTFSVKTRAARTGRNPKTGETIQIAATKTPHFKAGKALKDAVN